MTSLAKVTLCLIVLAAMSVGLGRSWKGMVPLGRLLAPSGSLWHQAPPKRNDIQTALNVALEQAQLPAVRLVLEADDIPHIEASDARALYFAQGFVTAAYRLWAMDFSARVVQGRLAEILGPEALPLDRFFRRLHFESSIRASATLMQSDPVTKEPIEAYSSGVNAWIARLDAKSLPLEYRFFGATPEAWSAEHTASLMKFMTWQLTGTLFDFKMTETKAKLDESLFADLFPYTSGAPGSILQPTQSRANEKAPGAEKLRGKNASLGLAPEVLAEIESLQPHLANGSNNWAVPAKFSASGRALLANDLHLSYSLPALWFSIQLTGPGVNVYGASLPGAPGVVVGFNETMGWAVTNGTDDVLDWYSLRFRDERRSEYLFEESWRPVIVREETIHVAGGKSESVRVRETHIGPIVYDIGDAPAVAEMPQGLAMQWIGHLPSNELRSFLMLNRAREAGECLEALKTYTAPSQNFVCADSRGKIVYKHAGLFPDRKGHDGRVVREAAQSSDLWQGYLSTDKNPVEVDARDYVVTANQAPWAGDASSDFGWFFRPPYRALSIRSQLESQKRWRPEELARVQSNATDWFAGRFASIMQREAGLSQKLQAALDGGLCGSKELTQEFKNWRGEFAASARVPTLVNKWGEELRSRLWSRLIGPSDRYLWPSSWRFYELIEREPHSGLWDDASTPVAETLAEQATLALEAACQVYSTALGASVPVWSEAQPTAMRHMGRLPGLGRVLSGVGGSGESPFANKGDHGPTWSMIVSFEAWPRAWVMIPGGQSGHPASSAYDDLLADWAGGRLREVKFLARSMKEAPK